MKDYAAIATAYARDVVELRIPAGKLVRLACARHLRNIDQAAAGWAYAWNPELVDRHGKTYRPADRICRFAELMPHIKGDWAARGERIRLEPWQAFFLASVFGWVDVETQKRRFRQADLIVPRKNAKSTIAAIIGLYMLAVDNEFGAEVYSGATSKDQALEVFRPAQLMAKNAGEFRARYGVEVNASNISVVNSNSKFEPLIGDPGDGQSPSLSITDEYHEHKTSAQYDTMITGMGARSQPLALMITTAGYNIGGPCYVHQVELERILDGTVANEQRFGLVYGIDKEDDWTDPAVLVKANPNYGISVSAEFLKIRQIEAVTDPRKQAVFKTKHLDVWVAAASPWINLQSFQAAGDATLTRESLSGSPCVAGLDLASKTDIASHVDLFRRRESDGKWHYYLFTRNYLPEAAIQKPENAHYQDWVERGHLIKTAGNMIDLHEIREGVEAQNDLCNYDEIACDAWGSREIAPQLQSGGYTVVDIPMTTRNLSEPMKEIAALVDAGRFHHDGNLATTWMFSNVEVFEDRNENVFPRKASAEKKIDAAVACIIAMARLMVGAREDESFWAGTAEETAA